MKNPIFIIGLPRSGTTILGEFFENSSKCIFILELDIWERQTKEKVTQTASVKSAKLLLKITNRNAKMTKFIRNIQALLISLHLVKGPDAVFGNKGHRLDENDVTPEKEKRARSYLSEKRLVVKHPYNSLRIPFIKKIFPDAKFVYISRDPRDVISSMLNSPSNILWTYTKPPGWKIWKKYSSGPVRCAWQVKKTIDIINEDKLKIPEEDFIEIKYEELLANPEYAIKNLFKKLSLPIEETHKELYKKVQDRMSPKDLAKDDALTVFDHTKRIGRYKESLSKEDIECIEFILKNS